MQRVIAYIDGYNVYHGLRAKRVVVAFPPKRSSFALQKAANATLHIGHNELSKSLFPDTVIKPNGVALNRPAHWR